MMDEQNIDYSTITPEYLEPEQQPRPTKRKLTWDDADDLADSATAPDYLINGILEKDSHGLFAGAWGIVHKRHIDVDAMANELEEHLKRHFWKVA